MKYTIRLEKTIQENRFEPFRAEFAGEYDSEFVKYEDGIKHAMELLEKILAARTQSNKNRKEYPKQ